MAVTAHATGTKTCDIGTFTVTIASPAVFSRTNQLSAGDKVVFSTTSALPTGLTAGTTYYVIAAGLSGSAFEVSATDGGSAVNTSGSQSGTHSMVTEHFLTTSTAAATYEYNVDPVLLAAADWLVCRVYKMILTGGTARVIYTANFSIDNCVTDDMIKVSVPVSTSLTDATALRFSIQQTFGTARAIPYVIEKFA